MTAENLSAAAQDLLNLIRDGWMPIVELSRNIDREAYNKHYQYYVTSNPGKIISSEAIRAYENGGFYIERENAGMVPTGETRKSPWGEEIVQMAYNNSADLDQNALWELIEAGLVEEKFYATESITQTDDYAVFALVDESTEAFVAMTTIGVGTGLIFLAEGNTEQEAFNNGVASILPIHMWKHANLYEVTKRKNMQIVTKARACQLGYRGRKKTDN
jgi:hypothetical protein